MQDVTLECHGVRASVGLFFIHALIVARLYNKLKENNAPPAEVLSPAVDTLAS